jgi:hypothetical protein
MRASAIGAGSPASERRSASAVWNTMVRACSVGTAAQQLAAHQRQVDQAPAEGAALAGDEQRLGNGAAHQAGRAHAVRQARVVHHVGHLLEAAAGSPTSQARAPSSRISPLAIERVPSLSFSRRMR